MTFYIKYFDISYISHEIRLRTLFANIDANIKCTPVRFYSMITGIHTVFYHEKLHIELKVVQVLNGFSSIAILVMRKHIRQIRQTKFSLSTA